MHTSIKLFSRFMTARSGCQRVTTGRQSAFTSVSQKLGVQIRQSLILRHSSSHSTFDGDDGADWPENDVNYLYSESRQRRNYTRDDRYHERDHRHRHSFRPREERGGYHGRIPRIQKPFRNSRHEDWDLDSEEFDYRRNPRRERDFMDDMGADLISRDGLGSDLKAVDWSKQQLNPFERNFYVEHPSVRDMTEEELKAFYQTHDIKVAQGEIIKPILDFKHANFPEPINEYISSHSWTAPTPIQSLGWPIALSGKNMVGIAQTGSGKTLGFVLPGLVHIKHQRQVARGEGPVALVLAPTRELTQQIKQVCLVYGRTIGVRSTSIFGGQSKFHQAKLISEGPEIVVATPGRLLDFLSSGVISLERTTYLVLDEADRMLDMGFEPQIRKILSQIRPDRQLLLWSATWPQEIRQLARDFLGKDFTQINIGSAQLKANPNITQTVKVCERRDKFSILLDELESNLSASEKTLIFVQTKSHADILTRKLRSNGFQALAIHGDKSQLQRDKTLDNFKRGRASILVATDVASRGLDVNDIELVVNFDYPNTADDYIHRIGRTARAQKSGRSLTLITEDDAGKVKDLISVLINAGQPVPDDLRDLEEFHMNERRYKSKNSRSRFGRSPYPPRHFGRDRF